MTLEDDRGSLATIGSDEEPLEGDTSEHVEAMLRACLDPDERQLSDDDDDDHVVDPLLYKSSQIEAAAELDLKSLADSELDETRVEQVERVSGRCRGCEGGAAA